MSSSSFVSDFGTRYCSLCDQYFMTKSLLYQHLESSPIHPRCKTCEHSYLNMNSLRNHYVYSSRHHYCRACDKTFKSAAGLRVHLEQSSVHCDGTDDDEEEEEDRRPDGWEDEIARREEEAERRRQTEEKINFEEENRVSPFARTKGMLELKARKRLPHSRVLRYSCPICLSSSSATSATRCGHMFCTPCIEQVIENSGACPTCRKPGLLSQLRKIDLRMF